MGGGGASKPPPPLSSLSPLSLFLMRDGYYVSNDHQISLFTPCYISRFFSHFPSAVFKGTCREIFLFRFFHVFFLVPPIFSLATFIFFKNSPRYIATQGAPPANVGTFTASVNDTSGHTVPKIYCTLIVVTLRCQRRCRNLPLVLTINVRCHFYGAVRSGFEGGLSITRGILGGGGGPKIETFLGP